MCWAESINEGENEEDFLRSLFTVNRQSPGSFIK